jgi:hypothetical protein
MSKISQVPNRFRMNSSRPFSEKRGTVPSRTRNDCTLLGLWYTQSMPTPSRSATSFGLINRSGRLAELAIFFSAPARTFAREARSELQSRRFREVLSCARRVLQFFQGQPPPLPTSGQHAVPPPPRPARHTGLGNNTPRTPHNLFSGRFEFGWATSDPALPLMIAGGALIFMLLAWTIPNTAASIAGGAVSLNLSHALEAAIAGYGAGRILSGHTTGTSLSPMSSQDTSLNNNLNAGERASIADRSARADSNVTPNTSRLCSAFYTSLRRFESPWPRLTINSNQWRRFEQQHQLVRSKLGRYPAHLTLTLVSPSRSVFRRTRSARSATSRLLYMNRCPSQDESYSILDGQIDLFPLLKACELNLDCTKALAASGTAQVPGRAGGGGECRPVTGRIGVETVSDIILRKRADFRRVRLTIPCRRNHTAINSSAEPIALVIAA